MNRKNLIATLTILTIIASSAIQTFAQAEKAASSKDDKPLIFRMKTKYPVKTYNVYKFNEKIRSKRVYSDKSEKNYDRNTTYYTTILAPDRPDEGIQTVNVSVDSMEYRFREGEFETYFNSQAEETADMSFFDMEVAAVPLSREFEMTYSPYSEVVKIEGEDLDWLREYVLVQGKDLIDTLKKYVWIRGVSKDNLEYIADPAKKLLPSKNVGVDSSWTSLLNLIIDGADFEGKIDLKLLEYSDGAFFVEGDSLTLKPAKNAIRVYGITEQVDVLDGIARGSIRYKFNAVGVMRGLEADFIVETKMKIRREVFTQITQYTATWELLGQYKFQ